MLPLPISALMGLDADRLRALGRLARPGRQRATARLAGPSRRPARRRAGAWAGLTARARHLPAPSLATP